MKSDYNRDQMAQALADVGLKHGDVVFSHSNIGYFGFPEGGRTATEIFQTILEAFQDVIGAEGTLVVPTFTYSFCKGLPFDPASTPSTCGIFTEMVRQHPAAYRSHDPIFSVSALGEQAKFLADHVSIECFGKDSFWDRFLHADGIICNLNFDAGSTFIHYIERCLNVPYRYDKLFTGFCVNQGQLVKGAAIYFCQDLSNPDTVAAFEPFDALARKQGVAKSAIVGRGAVTGIRAASAYRLIETELTNTPWLLTTAAKTGKTPILVQPANADRFDLSLPKNASLEQMVVALWRLPRDILSDGYDVALNVLAEQVPMKIHEYPTGTHCWTWIVPEKWTCHEACLETLDGRRLFSYEDNPLHIVSYSLPFEGEVSRAQLFEHLYIHPKIPEAIPFKFKYYERDWGLCCSKNLRDTLTDERYKVRIKSGFSYSTLKVGEVVVPGKTDTCIILCAHLCHPAQVNDDLTGVVVGLDVMRELLKRNNLYYTYRFLIVPETIGSLAYLSHNEALIPKMKGGLFLEMLGLENPHALQLSFQGNTEMDQCCTLAMQDYDPYSWQGAYRKIVGNDERQFNAPGVRVPMLSLSRVLPPTNSDWPFRRYHSDQDSLELVSFRHLEDSRNLVLRMIDALESNEIPVNKFKGEVFCSRYGLHIDFYTNPEGNRALFDILHLVDGSRSIAKIAESCGISFEAAKKTIDELQRLDLVEYTR